MPKRKTMYGGGTGYYKRTSSQPSRFRAGVPRRSSAGKNALVRVPRNKLNFPTSMRTKLRFVRPEQFTLVSPGNAHVRTFRANGIYDPVHAANTTGQPRGYNEFMAVYKTFTVTSSKISVNFVYSGYDGPSTLSGSNLIKQISEAQTPTVIAAQVPVICGVHRSADTFVGGTGSAQMEKDRTSWKFMTPSSSSVTVSGRVRIQDFFGKEALVGATGYTGTDVAFGDPEEEVFYHVWVAPGMTGYSGSPVTHVMGYITIEYDVTFTEPKQLGGS